LDLLVKTETPHDRAGSGGIQWVQTRSSASRGLVFIPPLIGGGPAQQLGAFRWLLKNDLDLFSFNYTGHGGSTGKFSLGASLVDTRRMLSLAANSAEKAGRPLYGIAACYATIPMLWGALTSDEPFRKVVLINPLTALYQGAFLRSVYHYCRTGFNFKRPTQSLKKAIDNYLEFLFPGITRSLAGFGTLSRKRTRILKILFEWLSSRTRLNFSLPQTPALCVYGRQDPILNLGGGAIKNASLDCIRTVCSPVTFHAINGDHFMSDPESRATTRQAIRSFLLTD
jgi:hypothetical protein